ncbi:MAG: hypothetical protein Q4D76_03070 [Oscillospiraceae bacterium]|nr:hypothetical protein [Oscillospiraceae bacterium]
MKTEKIFKILFFPFLAVVVYMVIWLVKGQPLLTKVGNTWMCTYSSYLDFDDDNLKESDIQKIQRFEWVEKFNGSFWNVNNLECIRNMKNLKTILISIYKPNNIIDWTGISNCSNIEDVYISGGELSDLSSFVGLKKLKSLALEWGREGAEIDIQKISELTSLEYLIIEGYTIKNVEALSDVSTLKSIIIKGRAEDIVSSCPADNLEILCYKAYSESEFEASDFLRFENLKKLSVTGAYINNIENIVDMKNLEEISVDGELYSDDELSVLESNGMYVNR